MTINGSEALIWVLALAFVFLVVFFVLREFWTWYWKQSEQVALLKEIRDSLRTLEARPGALPLPAPTLRTPLPPAPPVAKKSWRDAVLDRMAGVP